MWRIILGELGVGFDDFVFLNKVESDTLHKVKNWFGLIRHDQSEKIVPVQTDVKNKSIKINGIGDSLSKGDIIIFLKVVRKEMKEFKEVVRGQLWGNEGRN